MARAPRSRRRFLRLRWIAPAVIVLLSPAIFSYSTTMMKPSSLPLRVRSVEWLRQHHGNWLVDTAEHLYYGLTAPDPGGSGISSLPSLGLPPSAGPAHPGHHAKTIDVLARPIMPVFARSLHGEGVWKPTGPKVNGGPPVLVTTFRPELAYPQIVAYVAWFDHTRTNIAYYPGRYEPPNAPVRGPMMVPHSQRSRLLATFNSGFIHADGNNGSSINGRTYEPLQKGLATLIAYRNGSVDIRSWAGGPN